MLLLIFDKVKTSKSEIALIRGFAGSGKLALGYNLNKHIVNQKGICITGYLCVHENYCNLLLEEEETKFIEQRELIQSTLGNEGKLLTGVIKNLHLVIGPQPNLTGRESKHCFNYALSNFLNAISSAARPLVMFIDSKRNLYCIHCRTNM